MRLIRFLAEGIVRVGVWLEPTEGGFVDVPQIVDLSRADPGLPDSMPGLLPLITGPNPVGRARLDAAIRSGKGRRSALGVSLMQPVDRPGKILGIGLNYRDHATEQGKEPPAIQTWFVKQASAAHAPYAPVEMPSVSSALDYEVELVVVIGRHGRHVPAERASEIIAGYCVGCDYSVRDWQRATPTMIMGKGFDTHAPFGPWIVTPDQLGPLDDLALTTKVNGDLRQTGRVGDMIFNVAAQIEHLTKAFTLEPGDVLFTGTPAGVGAAFNPPRFLQIGDHVELSITGIGQIAQTIIPGLSETRIG
jgi:2-keto-4-pentenoate hydratase/2-oxohepta-3-ene-1,7-dioic acid hydratase in catechol pathway